MVKAGSDNLRAALANFGELDAALAPLRCLPEMLHATAPRVFPPEPSRECQQVGEMLEMQKQPPGHGGLNLSVARDMARVEDHDRAATCSGAPRSSARVAARARLARHSQPPGCSPSKGHQRRGRYTTCTPGYRRVGLGPHGPRRLAARLCGAQGWRGWREIFLAWFRRRHHCAICR